MKVRYNRKEDILTLEVSKASVDHERVDEEVSRSADGPR